VAGLAGAVALAGLWWWDRRRIWPPASPVPRRRVRGWLLALVSLAGVLAGTQLVLFAPMQNKLLCATPIRLGDSRAYPLNCDSALYMELAHHPSLILQPDSLRQSRPGYIALSALMTRVFGPAAHALGLDQAYGQSDTAYIPLVLINLIVLVTAVIIMTRLLSRLGTPTLVTAALCLLLIVNDVTKAFFWTPHQQIFNILVPVATIAITRWVLQARPSWLAVAVLGLALGLAALIYANVLITLGVVGLVLLARGWRGPVLAIVLCLSFVIPNAAWIAYCKVVVGSYFDKDVSRWHEFVWLPQAASQGLHSLEMWVSSNLVTTGREFGSQAGYLLLVLAVLAVVAIVARAALGPVTDEQRHILISTVLTAVFAIIFCFGLGIIATRIMYQVVPPILVLIGWITARLASNSRTTSWLARIAVSLAALAYAGQVLTSHGPYS
jgi:hypothetical protein